MMNKIVRAENLSFSYDKTSSFIEDVTFSVEKGSYVCIVGANGSGKTTLSRLISGLLSSDKGDIFIDGVLLNSNSINDIRHYIGVIFQNPDNQYVATTLKEDIIFGLENHNVDPKKMDDIVNKVAKECMVEYLLNKEPSAMSGGQKQKGAIAGILALEPQILILDEASSMLDPVSKKELNELILRLKKEKGLTIISITHDTNEVLNADQILMLDKGKLIFDGNKDEFFRLDFDKLNIDLPYIIELEKALGYNMYLSEEEFFVTVGDKYENRI